MPSVLMPQSYRSMHYYVLQRILSDCDTRLVYLIFLMLRLIQSCSVQLTLIAQ